MNRIIIALFALVFVQLVSSQAACSDALMALTNNTSCFSPTDATSVITVCNETCRTIYDDIRSSCDNETVS